MAENETYQLKDMQTYLGETIMNVYYYHQTAGEGDAEDLAAIFVTDILPSIQAIQNQALVHDSLEILNYNNDEDFHSETLGASFNGDVSGEAMPRFVTFAYKVARQSRNVRNGSKRYAGVSENWQVGGVAQGTGVVEALEALATALEAKLIDGNGNEYELRIGSFVGGSGNPLPAEVSAVSYVRISTQNSRKR